MKNASLLLSSLSFIGVLILFGLYFSKNKGNSGAVGASVATTGGVPRIAFINADTFEAKYEYLKEQKDAFNKHQDDMEGELGRSYQQMQNDAADIQRKAQAQTLTQSEYEAASKKMSLMQQSLENRRQSQTEQLLKEREELNKSLQNRLDSFLTVYNKDKHFDYILSYSSSILSTVKYANKQLDITKDIVDGMNALSKSEVKKK